MDELQTIEASSFAYRGMSCAHFLRTWHDTKPLDPNPVSETFMVVIPMQATPAHGGWLDGRRVEFPAHPAGSVGYLDWRQSWAADLQTPFETMNFFVPLSSFNELTDELGGHRIDSLSCPASLQADVDPHALGFAATMQPILSRPHEASALLADYLFGAVRLHLAVRYGGLRITERRRGGRLAGWQERRAKEIMLDDLGADVSIEAVAAACGLSGSQFERAFKTTTGMPPHRWRLSQRARRARELLDSTALSLAEIAQICGFADQSHLNRVFAGTHGVTPGAYRRMRGR
ncbi:AraC family transcriptional regulator [Paraburkholderia sp. BL23I1N1]|uniref:AraC family transcriptional regulator n=1 Tax=Paraburkholderia sp. BL23I1N1 TaxID=1938802 RepID=UPI001600D552|nr:AraC family transcriptional regulator [Paraburkholderia sp. BL23I1N1]